MLMPASPNGRLPEAKVVAPEKSAAPKPLPGIDLVKLRATCKRWLNEAALSGEEPADFTTRMRARADELEEIATTMGVTTDEIRSQLMAIEGSQQDESGAPRETYAEMKVAARKTPNAHTNVELVKTVTRAIAEVCANYEARYLAAVAKKKAAAAAGAKTAVRSNGAAPATKPAAPAENDFDALVADVVGPRADAPATTDDETDFDFGDPNVATPVGDVNINVGEKPTK